MATAGSIVVDLLMRTGSFETDTARAEKRMKALAKEFDRSAALIGTAMIGATVAVAAWVKSSIDAADEAYKQAQSVGLLVEEYSALTYAASLSGVEQDELAASLAKLARQAAEAASGNEEAAATFNRLGIQVKGVDGKLKNTDQLLGELADRFQAMPDGVEKTALAIDVFGRSGAKLIPMLNAGRSGLEELKREAQALGVVLDTETAKAAERLNDDLERLQTQLKGVGISIAREVLPWLNELMEELLVGIKVAGGFGDALFALGTMTPGSGIQDLREDLDDLLEARKRQTAAGVPDIGLAGLDQAIKTASLRLAYLEELERRANRAAAASNVGTAGSENDFRRGRGVNAGAGFITESKEDEAARKKAEAARERELAKLREFAEEQRKLSLIISDFGSTQSEAETARLARLEDVLASLPPVIVPVQTAVEEMTQAFLRSEKAAYDIDYDAILEEIDKVDDRTKRFLDNVQDAFGQTLYSTLKGDFDSILDLWTDMIVRMVAEAAAADLAAALGFDGAKGGNLDKLFSTVVGFFTGGGRAGGGPVQRGGLYPINEMGGPGEVLEVDDRQYLLAAQAGSITPLTASMPSYYDGRAGGGVQVNVKVQTLPGESAEVTQQRNGNNMDIGVRIVRQVLREDMANKGPISRDMAGTFGLNRASGAPRRG